jgi:hypothetical protein
MFEVDTTSSLAFIRQCIEHGTPSMIREGAENGDQILLSPQRWKTYRINIEECWPGIECDDPEHPWWHSPIEAERQLVKRNKDTFFLTAKFAPEILGELMLTSIHYHHGGNFRGINTSSNSENDAGSD